MEGYAANRTKHCVRPADVHGLTVSVMLRHTLANPPTAPAAPTPSIAPASLNSGLATAVGAPPLLTPSAAGSHTAATQVPLTTAMDIVLESGSVQ